MVAWDLSINTRAGRTVTIARMKAKRFPPRGKSRLPMMLPFAGSRLCNERLRGRSEMNDSSPSTRRGKRQAKLAETNMKLRFTFLVLLALGASLLLTGCAGILPIPPFSNKVEAGRKLERRDASFIVPGCTTQIEVGQRLGRSSRDCPRPPAVAYSWEKPGWTIFWWVAAPFGGVRDNFPAGGWDALFVTFDAQGIVLQKDFVRLSHQSSLDDQLERWANRVREKKKTRTRTAR